MAMLCIAGKNNIAVNALDYALNMLGKSEIIALPNEDDDGVDSWQHSLIKFCRSEGITILPLEELYSINDLIFLSLEYNRIIKPALFRSVNLFNIHFSKLPKYRGMYTSAWPILNGEIDTGVTLHQIDHGIDTGAIIDQITFEISGNDTALDVYHKYIKYGTMLVKENLSALIEGTFISREQPLEGASYYGKDSIDYANLKLNLKQTAFHIRNQIRAFSFPVYQMPSFHSKVITYCEILRTRSIARPGTVLSENDDFAVISSVDFDLKLERV